MPSSPHLKTLLVVLSASLALEACGDGDRTPSSAARSPHAGEVLQARRGVFERTLSLTGELDAVSAVELKVPRVPSGKVALRKLAPEGSEVKAGDVMAGWIAAPSCSRSRT